MKKISLQKAKELGDLFQINYKVLPLKNWKYALEVELEHGLISPYTNVSDDDLIITAKIALAHLLEFPDYYLRLKKMEHEGEKYWENKTKPDLFL